MTDTTNWRCPDCGSIVSGPSHTCSGHRVGPIDPRDARLALAHEIAEAARDVSEWYNRDGTVGGAVDPMERLDDLLARYFAETDHA